MTMLQGSMVHKQRKKTNVLVYGQMHEHDNFYNLTGPQNVMEPLGLRLSDFFKCGWKLKRKVTYLGTIHLIGFAKPIGYKTFRYTYYLEYEGDRKCLRIPKHPFPVTNTRCNGYGCLFYNAARG